MSLKQYIYAHAMAGGSGNDRSRSAAKKNAAKFVTWINSANLSIDRKTLCSDHKTAVTVIQQYEIELAQRGLSPNTIHTYLYVVCRGLGVQMNEIHKPKRTSDSITRSRGDKNERGLKEKQNPRNARLVAAQSIIGIRRDELAALRGRDIQYDESGYLCVCVERGKGGKQQLQRILPHHEKAVRELFRDCGKDALLFDPADLRNKIDLHGMRAEHARECYAYYVNRMNSDPNYRDQLKSEMMARWDAMHKSNSSNAKRNKFHNEVDRDTPIYLRKQGANYVRAVKNNRPVVYDRTAVLAVSVFHLSHWRTDVTVTNYLV